MDVSTNYGQRQPFHAPRSDRQHRRLTGNGRYLIGLSKANRRAAGVATGDQVEVDVVLDVEPRVVVEPRDFAHALDADPRARSAYDRLSYSHKREHVRAIESAKKPETRVRRIETAIASLRYPEKEKA